MNLQYEIRSGSYYLVDLDEPPNRISHQRDIHLMTDEIAICFDRSSGTLHKHGNPESVGNWAAKAQAKYRDAGYSEMANDLIVVSGKLPVEEINRCIANSGYCSTFYNKLASLTPEPSAGAGNEQRSTRETPRP